MDDAQAIAKARSMQATARHHKRRQGYHRDRVKQTMRDLERHCREHGIEFVLEKEGVVQHAARVQDAPATLRTEL